MTNRPTLVCAHMFLDTSRLILGSPQDAFRKCTGAQKHRRLTHIADSVKDAKVV